MDKSFEIYPLYLGEAPMQEKSGHTYQHNQGIKVRTIFFSYLLIGNGKNILIDTGPCSEEWALKHHKTLKILIPPGRDILTVLKQEFDIMPENIDYIINTHLHWDHSFSNHLFPNKKIFVQRKELHYAIDPLPIHQSTYESPQTGLYANWLKSINQMVLLDGDTIIDDGIKVLLLPGHSEGLQGVLVNTADGKYLLASDCVNLYDNLEGTETLPYIVGGIHSDLRAYFITMDRIKELEQQGVKIIPGHDEKILAYKKIPI